MVKYTPILIGPHAIIYLKMLTTTSNIEDLWFCDLVDSWAQRDKVFEDGAKKLVEEFKGHETVAFLAHLMKACFEKIKEYDGETKTNHQEWALNLLNGKYDDKENG